jgi:hypothetical protein
MQIVLKVLHPTASQAAAPVRSVHLAHHQQNVAQLLTAMVTSKGPHRQLHLAYSSWRQAWHRQQKLLLLPLPAQRQPPPCWQWVPNRRLRHLLFGRHPGAESSYLQDAMVVPYKLM